MKIAELIEVKKIRKFDVEEYARLSEKIAELMHERTFMYARQYLKYCDQVKYAREAESLAKVAVADIDKQIAITKAEKIRMYFEYRLIVILSETKEIEDLEEE